jgi:zinc finger MYND domain-containing protein 10
LGVTNRILNTHDFIYILVDAIETSPWERRNDSKNNQISKYIDNKWKVIDERDRYQLIKVEGQVWISLYELLMSPQCNEKYNYDDKKKNQILKLRHHLNESLIDQIPSLISLQRFLEQLSMSEMPAHKSDLIIEQIAEIYDSIIGEHRGKWKDLAKKQANTVLNPSDNEIKEQAKR